ncbi:MAG: SPASM domain-containing protein [Planctomycetota bacterium]|nr:SPASM domain-containing protein [Planctomycetota bacterium]
MVLTNPLHLIKGILGRTLYIIPRQPERIQIEITNRCNCACGMCPRESFNLPEKDIPLDLFKKIIDNITQLSLNQITSLTSPPLQGNATESHYNIILTGWGEPLLHPALMDMIVYTKRKGHRVGVTTNGLLLAAFIEKFIEIPLDKLTISLDSVEECAEVIEGHPSNKVVLKNIESIIRSRGAKKKPIVTIQITMHGKQQCLDTVKFAGEVGADRVYLVRLNTPLGRDNFKRPSLEEELEIYKESERIAERYGLQVDNNYTAFDNSLFRLLYKKLRPMMYRFDKYCPKPYDYLYVNIDGNVTPCCDLPRYEVGNILKQSLDEIWHSENIQYFREHQNDVCGECDALRLKHLYSHE